jgi:predicted ribonuclease YlaK
MKWTIVLDTSSLLDKESRKPLQLLQGLKGTHLVVPRTVLRELNEVKRSRSFLFRRRTEIASSALDWIEECKVNSKWWIQVQSPTEETKAIAPTPPVTPQSNGSSAFPFSLHWNNYAPEIDSPTSEDQVLECALLYRNRNRDEKLVLLSNDVTLKIKAMAEGVICETPHEFYESLVNPFSERFMWTESTARGRTWSHLDNDVLRERYNDRACRRKSTYNRGESGAAAKGLKLILLHNSHYGHTH